MKKLAPFGKFLKTCLQSNQTPTNDVFLFIGTRAWEKSKNFQLMRKGTLCLPPYHDPSDYQWPVKNCDILIFDTSFSPQDYVDELILCLYMDKANIVRLFTTDDRIISFKREF